MQRQLTTWVHCVECDIGWWLDYEPPRCSDERHEWLIDQLERET